MISQKTKKKNEEIKALKESNQEKIYTKFKTFYKKYKHVPRPITSISPNPFTNNKNYKYRLYNNIKNKIIPTKYKNKNYKKNNKNIKKKK